MKLSCELDWFHSSESGSSHIHDQISIIFFSFFGGGREIMLVCEIFGGGVSVEEVG